MFGIPKIYGWLIKLKFNCGKTFFIPIPLEEADL